MNTIDNGRTEARSRANRRLRRMTIGTAMLGVAATGSFGWARRVDLRRRNRVRRRDRDGVGHRSTRPPRRSTSTTTGATVDDSRRDGGADRLDDHRHRPRVQRRLLNVIDAFDWRALGTGVRLLVLDGDAAAARSAVVQVLDEADLAFSRFRPDSELMAVNDGAGQTVTVGPLLARAIEGSLDAARRTGGAVDPTVGRAMRLIGYDADFDLLRPDRPLELRIESVPGWSVVAFNRRQRTVRTPRGVELDLGSTGKGLAADLAAGAAVSARRP